MSQQLRVGVPRVIVTRKEHNCNRCCSLIRAGSRVYGVTFEAGYKGLKNETRLYTLYYCGSCKPVEVKM